ncbi:hypothetical protein PUN28_011980 [Cardiocondyla obscurior]|uniref:Ribosomal protein L33 n=1 Tax=Cardiocondyla obscurior TaxID=286306 RepID=A0AAW2F8Q9_9HYME
MTKFINFTTNVAFLAYRATNKNTKFFIRNDSRNDKLISFIYPQRDGQRCTQMRPI